MYIVQELWHLLDLCSKIMDLPWFPAHFPEEHSYPKIYHFRHTHKWWMVFVFSYHWFTHCSPLIFTVSSPLYFGGLHLLKQIFLSMFLQNSTGISFLMKCNFYQFISIFFKVFFQYAEKNFMYDFIYYSVGFWDALTQILICILQSSYVFLIIIFDLAKVLWNCTKVTCRCIYTLTAHSLGFIAVKSCVIVIKSCWYLTWSEIYPILYVLYVKDFTSSSR